jgi:hypothetical protein
MTLPQIRRLLLLLVLLPQLLVLGLGRGVVICIEPGGHVRVEAAASTCCADDGVGRAQSAGALEETDCGSCSDVRIALDVRASRGPGHDRSLGGSERLQGALPVALPACTTSYVGRALARRAERGHVPPHPVRMRGVVLRC